MGSKRCTHNPMRRMALAIAASLCLAATAQAQTAAALYAQGRAAHAAGDNHAALRLFAQARALNPDDRDTRQAVADVLAELGAPFAALQAAPGDDAGLRARVAAERIRWAEQVDADTPQHRFDDVDQALAALDGLIVQAEAAQPRDDAFLQRLRDDKVVALRDRERYADALAFAATLPPPHAGYVREAEADSLLALRHPREARDAYADALRSQPDFRNAKIGKFYSEVEMEDFHAAFDTVDGLGAPVLAARARSFADMQTDAWNRLQKIRDENPDDIGLYELQGEFAAGRGWPRRSLQQIADANQKAPENLGFRIALAEALLRRRHWREAEDIADELKKIIPDNARLQRLLRDIALYHAPELKAEAAFGTSNGGGEWVNGDSKQAQARLYSAPLDERWRLFAAGSYDSAIPFDDWLIRNRVGAGVEGRWPDVDFEASLWRNGGMLDKTGAAASVRWRPDDHWNLEFGAQKFADDTPLRAINDGVSADSISAGVGYDWSQAHGIGASLSRYDFSDGNRRLQIGAHYTALVVDVPHLDIYLRPDVYASKNTLDAAQASYYNPARDASATLALDIRHVFWRSYEKSLAQKLVLFGGTYWERDYGSGPIYGASYEQTWQPSAWCEWNYGIAWAHRLYDGNGERDMQVFIRLDKRFR